MRRREGALLITFFGKSCRNKLLFLFLAFWPCSNLQLQYWTDLFWGLDTPAEVTSQIKMPPLSLTTLVFEINCNIWVCSSWHSICVITSQINTYSEVNARKGLATDKKWNTLIVNAINANRTSGSKRFFKSSFCFCTVMLVVISEVYTKQIQISTHKREGNTLIKYIFSQRMDQIMLSQDTCTYSYVCLEDTGQTMKIYYLWSICNHGREYLFSSRKGKIH